MALNNVSVNARVNQAAFDAVGKSKPAQAKVPADPGLNFALGKAPNDSASNAIQGALNVTA